MKKHFVSILLSLLLTATPYLSYAQVESGEGEQLPSSSDELSTHTTDKEIKKGFGVAPFASPGYTPETGFVVGAAVVFTYRAEDSTAEDRPSSLELLLMYSQREQWAISATPDFYFDKENWECKLIMTCSDYPDTFYGIGNDTEEDDEEDFKTEHIGLQPWIVRKVYSNLRAGIIYEINKFDVSEVEENGILDSRLLIGSDGGINSGIGPLLEWDSRDNKFYPARGGWYQFFTGLYRSRIGSDFDYEYYNLNLRHYVTALPSHILAFQVYGRFSDGKVPFPRLSKLELLRGIIVGRFQDYHAYTAQIEYRFPIAWRFSGVAFTGAGDVASGLDNFEISKAKFAGGGGIRFALNPQERINFRLDIGASPWDIGTYFYIMEAF